MTMPKSEKHTHALLRRVRRDWLRYMMILPGLIFFIVYRYIPMGGLLIAFQQYNPLKGISGSKWIGWQNFQVLFLYGDFSRAFVNTVLISIFKIITGYICTLSFALLLNEIRQRRLKRVIQTISYMPYFLSWVTIYSIFLVLFNPRGGIVTTLMTQFGAPAFDVLTNPGAARSVLVATSLWQSLGWGTIIYLAGLSGIDEAQYEAAVIDGASRFQKMRYISIPGIMPIIVITLILRVGGIMSENLDQIMQFQNPLVIKKIDVFETIVYRQGMEKMNYGYATAVGMFQSVVGLALVMLSNRAAKWIGEEGLW